MWEVANYTNVNLEIRKHTTLQKYWIPRMTNSEFTHKLPISNIFFVRSCELYEWKIPLTKVLYSVVMNHKNKKKLIYFTNLTCFRKFCQTFVKILNLFHLVVNYTSKHSNIFNTSSVQCEFYEWNYLKILKLKKKKIIWCRPWPWYFDI